MQKVIIAARLTPADVKNLEKLATERRWSLSATVEFIIAQYFDVSNRTHKVRIPKKGKSR